MNVVDSTLVNGVHGGGNVINLQTFGAFIISFFSFLAANKWIVPIVENYLKKKKEDKIEDDKHKIDIGQEIFETKEAAAKTYQQQLDFQLSHIENLQKIITKYQNDLKDVYDQVDKLQDMITELKKIVMENKITINNLKLSCCVVQNCALRQKCSDL